MSGVWGCVVPCCALWVGILGSIFGVTAPFDGATDPVCKTPGVGATDWLVGGVDSAPGALKNVQCVGVNCRWALVKVLTEIDSFKFRVYDDSDQYINRLLNLNYGYWSFKAMVIYLNIAWDLYDVLKPRQLKPLFPAWFKPPIITKVIIINSIHF